MANNDIKQKIVLEGEKEYKQALKDAQRELKTLRSELKAETAELGNNATAQEKQAVKVKNLQKQIQEQEKIVKTYTEALKEVKEKYGDNEDEIAKWEIKLNDARTALANMKNGLDDTANSVKQTTTEINTGVTAANSLSDSFGKLAEIGESVSSGIENIFTDVIGTIRRAVNAVWGELIEVAAKSDNYLDLAAYFGSSATEVQKWEKAMAGASGSLDTVTQLITKLKYSGKDKNVAQWFGISSVNYTNDLEYFQNVMQAMVDKRDQMIKAGTWDKAMADIFGKKKGFDVEGVLSDWDAILAGLERFNADEGGYGLSEEEIQKMADLNIQVQGLKESWYALLEKGTVHLFGDLALNLTGNAQAILDGFLEYFNAETPEERDEALKHIKENIEAVFKEVEEAIRIGIGMLNDLAAELQESEDPNVQSFGKLLGGLGDALNWLTEDNAENMKRALEIVAGAWTAGKVIQMVGIIGQFASALATIKTAGGVAGLTKLLTGGGIGAGAGVGTGAGATGIGATITAAIAEGISPLTAAITGGVMSVGVVAMAIPVIDTLSKYIRGEDPLGLNKTSGELLLPDADKETQEALTELIENQPEEIKKENWGKVLNRPLRDTLGELGIVSFGAQFKENRYENFTPEQVAAAEKYYDELRTADMGEYESVKQAYIELEKVLGDENLLLDITHAIEDMMAENWDKGPNPEDLPAEWWKKDPNENGVTSEDIANLNQIPSETKAAVKELIGSMNIYMDGEKVADLLTERVSQRIASEIEA